MRFSFENKYTNKGFKSVAGGPAGMESKYDNKFGVRKNRRCLNCTKEINDDGSIAYLRGFCSAPCMNGYLDGVKATTKSGWEVDSV